MKEVLVLKFGIFEIFFRCKILLSTFCGFCSLIILEVNSIEVSFLIP